MAAGYTGTAHGTDSGTLETIIPVTDRQKILVAALQAPGICSGPEESVSVLETHISWVILSGEYAWKIKKAVNFGFLDFSTLALRHKYCIEEVRLNSRYAADLYLCVVGIYGDYQKPSLAGDGEPIEYAVKMRQFPQDALLSRLLERGQLLDRHIDAMAREIAAFHEKAGRAARADPGRGRGGRGGPVELFTFFLLKFSK